jgi:hypothetical protein
MVAICHWLQHSDWATGIRQGDILFPLIEGSHILSLAISVGLVLILDLRLLHLALSSQPVSRVMRQVMPWALPGFSMMLFTGVLLFSAQAESVYSNRYFRLKIVLLLLLGVNALVFQILLHPGIAEWDESATVPVAARIIAIVSLVLWLAVITCGRLIAYEI